MSDTLKAGRKLNERVAVDVMGHALTAPDPDDLFGVPMLVINGRTDFTEDYEIPHFSTDIAAAELIVGRLTARGCRVGLSWRPDGDCRAFVFQPGYTSLQADAPTAAHALCLVALLACDDSAALATVPAPAGEPTMEHQS